MCGWNADPYIAGDPVEQYVDHVAEMLTAYLRAMTAPDGMDGHPCIRVEAYMAAMDRAKAAEAAVERVRALVDCWPKGDNGQDYRAAVTQCAKAIAAAIDGTA